MLQNCIKLDFYYKLLIIISIFKLVTSFFIPINFIQSALHDDALFVEQALALSNLNWLGEFNNRTMIKGAIFPIFLNTSLIFHIPLRLLESLLVIFSSLFFIRSLNFFKLSNNIKIILFILLIFSPIIYSSLDYRILRDMIYPWLLLLILSQLIIILCSIYSFDKFSWKVTIYNSFILSFFLFIFFGTREEGIWILPLLILFAFLIIFITIKNKRFKNFYFIFIPILFLKLFFLSYGSLNNFYYDTFTLNDFKNPSYVSGYSSILRVENDSKTRYDGPSFQTWDLIFQISPAARKLKSAIKGESYNNWSIMGCKTIIDQRPYLSNYDCSNNMVSSYLIFSFRDVLWDSGFKSPNDIYKIMDDIAFEIDQACDSGLIVCNRKIHNILPPSTFTTSAFIDALKNLPFTFKILFQSSYPDVKSLNSYGEYESLETFSDKFSIKIFPLHEKISTPSNSFIYQDDEFNVAFFINNILFLTYSSISSYGFILILLILCYFIRCKKYPEALLISSFLILIFTRAFMISILNLTAMAPISPLYLAVGTFSYYVCLIISIVLLINKTIK
jgi:hypothetical protein